MLFGIVIVAGFLIYFVPHIEIFVRIVLDDFLASTPINTSNSGLRAENKLLI
jgi:hypothetical protein